MTDITKKPLGQKSYGSIPHLQGSRLGESDKHCEPGHERIATIKARDKHDVIIVQEKLDGSNCCVARINNRIIALTRAGYLASTSPYPQHHYFEKWVRKNESKFFLLLSEGERAIGEWLLQAHGTRYNLKHEPFVIFDLMITHKRATSEEVYFRCEEMFQTPSLIHHGHPVTISEIESLLEPSRHGAIDPVEGAIWRVERKGIVDFLVKYVRKNKYDGIYLPEISGKEAVYNIDPKTI